MENAYGNERQAASPQCTSSVLSIVWSLCPQHFTRSRSILPVINKTYCSSPTSLVLSHGTVSEVFQVPMSQDTQKLTPVCQESVVECCGLVTVRFFRLMLVS